MMHGAACFDRAALTVRTGEVPIHRLQNPADELAALVSLGDDAVSLVAAGLLPTCYRVARE